MIIKIGKYTFKHGKGNKIKKLDPLSLEEIKDKPIGTLPNGKVLVKKSDYALVKVSAKEPIVKVMKKLIGHGKDNSKEFIILYVNKTFVGYLSKKGIRIIPKFKKKNYIHILEEYYHKKQKKPTEIDYVINQNARKKHFFENY